MTFVNFTLDVDADGIALVTWDAPGRSMNVIDLKVIEELSGDRRAGRGRRARSRARSSPPARRSFCAGADLTMLEMFSRSFTDMVNARGEEAANATLLEESRKLSVLYRRLETSGKPWVAAINGTALGGGFELCLACHQRVAADNAKTRVGTAGGQDRAVPGRRRHAARGAHAAARRRAAIPAQGRSSSSCRRPRA